MVHAYLCYNRAIIRIGALIGIGTLIIIITRIRALVGIGAQAYRGAVLE